MALGNVISVLMTEHTTAYTDMCCLVNGLGIQFAVLYSQTAESYLT